ncbi:MAG TPA: ankyrin repeat domain-containing protein [Gaiellaceae bacterium]|jgi:ankyrin repeat protein|nr:ankyrin repeat domain-containing protein [Gaiellaceae bacterium]
MSIFELIDANEAAGVHALIERDSTALDSRDDGGLTPLMHAAYRGRRAVFHVIAGHGSDDPWDRLLLGESDGLPAPDAWSPDGFTPLHIAAFAENAAGAQALLDAGADPNVFARASFARVTPLGTCAFAGATAVARALIRAGANAALTEVEGGSPLEAAFQNGYQDLVAVLVVAVAHGDTESVRVALERDATLANATVDWADGDWESALGAASHMHRRDIAELLLEHGARLDVFAAAALGDVDTVRAVLEMHPEMRDAKGPHGIPLSAHATGAVRDLFT